MEMQELAMTISVTNSIKVKNSITTPLSFYEIKLFELDFDDNLQLNYLSLAIVCERFTIMTGIIVFISMDEHKAFCLPVPFKKKHIIHLDVVIYLNKFAFV